MNMTETNIPTSRRLFRLSLPISIALILLMVLLLSFAQAIPGGAAAAALYVDGATGSDDPACGTAAAPCQTISYTLATRASQGDSLLIAAGTYAENLAIDSLSTTLHGGYTISGTQWLTGTGETVIDGGSAGRTFFINNGTVVLEDLTITGGAADSAECWGDTFWVTNAEVTIRNATIKDSQGACTGIEINHDFGPAHLTMEKSSVSNLSMNGALHVWGGNSSASIQNVTFSNNTSGEFGTVHIDFNATAAITGTQIFSNTAGVGGGGVVVRDGATAVIRDSEIYSNTALGEGGGGIRVEAGALDLIHSVVRDNNAPNGQSGGIDVRSSGTVTVTDSILSGNTTRDHGGAATVAIGGVLNLTNTLVSGNATTSGNANVFAVSDGQVTVMNSTVADNNPQAAQAVLLWSGSLTMTNSIMWNNAFNLQGDPPCPSCFDVSFSIVEGGYTGTGNINMDPLFAGMGDYRLLADSPAIDSGTDTGAPDHDINQVARPQDGDGDGTATTDMGAYEFVLHKIFLPLILTDLTP